MLEFIKDVLRGQFEASLCMLDDCINCCPPQQWDGLIGKYPFWQVVYHTLCFVDLYLSPDARSFELRDGRDGEAIMHPAGWKEFDDEYPSRRFEQVEMLAYLKVCRAKLLATLAAETAESLQGGSGQPHLPFSRGELHVYSLRHVQHHTGQLSAFLRRVRLSQNPRWVKTGGR
jgi:hypothetical protein